MFHLESAISDWRSQMLVAGIQSPVPLDELEGHLREDITRQIQAGVAEADALELAARRLGPAAALSAEFLRSTRTNKGVNMIRIIATIVGLFAMALGLGLVLPALAQHHRYPSSWTQGELSHITTGVIIIFIGAVAAFYCIRTRRETHGRVIITLALLLASLPFFGTGVVTVLSHSSELTAAGWVIWAVAFVASAVYFCSCFRYNWRPTKRA